MPSSIYLLKSHCKLFLPWALCHVTVRSVSKKGQSGIKIYEEINESPVFRNIGKQLVHHISSYLIQSSLKLKKKARLYLSSASEVRTPDFSWRFRISTVPGSSNTIDGFCMTSFNGMDSIDVNAEANLLFK